jgi:hypothetical protein
MFPRVRYPGPVCNWLLTKLQQHFIRIGKGTGLTTLAARDLRFLSFDD